MFKKHEIVEIISLSEFNFFRIHINSGKTFHFSNIPTNLSKLYQVEILLLYSNFGKHMLSTNSFLSGTILSIYLDFLRKFRTKKL